VKAAGSVCMQIARMNGLYYASRGAALTPESGFLSGTGLTVPLVPPTATENSPLKKAWVNS